MRYSPLCMIWGCWGLLGCGSSTFYLSGPQATLSVQEASEQLGGRKVTVVDVDSVREMGVIKRLSADSLVFYSSTLDSIRTKSLTDVHKVIKPASGGQKTVGLILGLAVGTVVGGLAGHAVLAVTGEPIMSNQTGGAQVAATVLIIGGMTAGIVVGANAARETNYEFSPLKPRLARRQDEYFVLHVDTLMEETPKTVTLIWKGATRILPKSQIEVEKRVNGKYILRIPKRLLGE